MRRKQLLLFAGFWIFVDGLVLLYQFGPKLLYQRYLLSKAQRNWSELPTIQAPSGIGIANDGPPETTYSIVIPIYCAIDDVSTLLLSLSRDIPKNAREIVLVDDGSNLCELTHSLHQFAIQYPCVRIVVNEENIGFAKSVAIGITKCTTDYLLILNSDTVPPAGALDRLMEHFGHNEKLATICPMSNHAAFANVGTPPDLIEWNARNICALDQKLAFAAANSYSVPFSSGFCWGVRRSIFDQLGGYSEAFHDGYGEEADFCLRAWTAGYSCAVATNSVVYHRGNASFGSRQSEKRSRYQSTKLLELHPYFLELVEDQQLVSNALDVRKSIVN